MLICRDKTFNISLSLVFLPLVLCRYTFADRGVSPLFLFCFECYEWLKNFIQCFSAFIELNLWLFFMIINGWIARILTTLVTLYCTLHMSGLDLLIFWLGFFAFMNINDLRPVIFSQWPFSGFDIKVTLMSHNNLWAYFLFFFCRKEFLKD